VHNKHLKQCNAILLSKLNYRGDWYLSRAKFTNDWSTYYRPAIDLTIIFGQILRYFVNRARPRLTMEQMMKQSCYHTRFNCLWIFVPGFQSSSYAFTVPSVFKLTTTSKNDELWIYRPSDNFDWPWKQPKLIPLTDAQETCRRNLGKFIAANFDKSS